MLRPPGGDPTGGDLQRLRPAGQEVPQAAQGVAEELGPRGGREVGARHQEPGGEEQELEGEGGGGHPGEGAEEEARLEEEEGVQEALEVDHQEEEAQRHRGNG